MAVAEIPVTGHQLGTGNEELRRLRLWQLTDTPSTPIEGNFWFNSNVGNKRIYFYDAVAVAGIPVPRLDRNEVLTGQWSFSPGSVQAPFVLGANAQDQKVTGLHADKVDGFNLVDGAAGGVVFRSSASTLTAANNLLWDDTTKSLGIFASADPAIALQVTRTGAVAISHRAGSFFNGTTSSTASIEKFGLVVQSTGTWNGASSVNYGILISTSGGTVDWALYNSGTGNVYLGSGITYIGSLSQNQVVYAGALSGSARAATGVTLNTTATVKFLTQVSSGVPIWTDLYAATNTWTGANTFSGAVIVPTPTLDDHAATKSYVDSAVTSGLRVLSECVVATTANITLSGEQTIDGVLTSGSRVLVKNQSAPAQNGIYVSAAGAWARATDCDAAGEITAGAYTFITMGTTSAGTSWVQSLAVTTIGTDPVTWIKFFQQAAFVEGSSIDITGQTISIDPNDSVAWMGIHTFNNTGGVTLDPYNTGTGQTTELRFRELTANGTSHVGFKAPDSIGTTTIWTLPSGDGSANHYLKTNGSSVLLFAQIASTEINNSSFVTSVTGTANRITIAGTLTPTVDIHASYIGQNTITTLGTITTGAWNGTAIGATFGGTGQTGWTQGQLVYAPTTNALNGLAIGAVGRFLWVNAAGTLPEWSGYRLPATVAVNQLLYGSSGTAVSALATVANRILTTDGTGNIAWANALPTGTEVAGDASSKVTKIQWFNVGNGSSDTVTITHNFNTRDVVVQLVETASPYKTVIAAIGRTTVNTVDIEFTFAPATNAYRCAVIAAI